MNLQNISSRVLSRVFANRPYFATRDVVVGRHVSFGRNVVFNCKRVRIGDGVIFQDDVLVNADVFEVGDYGTFYRYCFVPGPGELRIGHNFWVGASSIIDATGGARIGNNVAIGAHSQFWTHIGGDVMYGHRFYSKKKLEIGNDVLLYAHSLVSPVTIGDRSLVCFGSLVTKDIPPDRTYAGSPAQDVTERFGPQFKVTSTEDRRKYFENRLREFDKKYPKDCVFDKVCIASDSGLDTEAMTDKIVFNVADRTYAKRGTKLENRLMRFLLPDAKFVPASLSR